MVNLNATLFRVFFVGSGAFPGLVQARLAGTIGFAEIGENVGISV